MGKGKLERFSIIEKTHLSQPYRNAIAGEETNALSKDRLVDWIKNDNDLEAFVVGAVVEVSGTVQKCVRREGECKLVIEPGDVPGFVVFADCPGELETVRNSKIRKGSSVSVRGKLRSFGSAAVCLSDCHLQRFATLKKKTENLRKPKILKT
jgi:ribosome-associated protein YbcJ (S4-like RNA binding protein)